MPTISSRCWNGWPIGPAKRPSPPRSWRSSGAPRRWAPKRSRSKHEGVTVSTIAEASETQLKDGRIVAIVGPVVDAEFPANATPEINTALEFDIDVGGATIRGAAEGAQHIGEGRVRTVALKPADGL